MFLQTILTLILITSSIELTSCEDLKLTILHNNDFHARFAPTNVEGAPCSSSKSKPLCYGGAARTVSFVKSVRATSPDPVLFLNAGDFFQGTIWYTLFKEKVTADFINQMGYDAMTLGNHEFDDGVTILRNFLDLAKVPIICSNTDFSNEPLLMGRVNKSIVLTVNNIKIGIIGVVVKDTKFLSSPGPTVTFLDEIESVKQEAIRLNNDGVKILIGLSHSGYFEDLKIAESVPQLSLIVGGHSNTFLYSPKTMKISTETPTDNYPKIVGHSDGTNTLVVQAFAYGKYVGLLNATFDTNTGRITKYAGNPILMDSKIPEDEEIKQLVTSYQSKMSSEYKQVIGSSRVKLEGEDYICRVKECMMGNLYSDMVMFHFLSFNSTVLKSNNENVDENWTNYPIVLINAGIIRSTIDPGDVTIEDAISVLPFGNQISAVHITGAKLMLVLENSVRNYEKGGEGRFLQVSGVKVVYDVNKPKGSRVKSVRVRCRKCLVPQFEPLNLTENYTILTSDYLMRGGDGYDMLIGADSENFNIMDIDIMKSFITKWSPLVTQIEDRIRFYSESENENCGSSAGKINHSSILPYLLFSFCVTMLCYR